MPSAHPDMPERKFAYTWSRTWADRFVRLHRKGWRSADRSCLPIEGGPGDGRWKWAMTASRGNGWAAISGVADSRDDACQIVEDHYRRFAADRP